MTHSAHSTSPDVPSEARPVTADERELLAALLRRDRKAAAQFVAAHIDAVHAYVRHRLAPRADQVDDVVQDVFVAALDSLPRFQGTSSLRTWIMGIARHKVADLYRHVLSASARVLDVDDVADAAVTKEPSMDELLDASRVRDKTQNVLARLPERYGLLLLWRYWEQQSTRDIAVAIGTTEKSVERALARARAQFKQLWTE